VKKYITLLLLFVVSPLYAQYNANMKGVVTDVLIYSDSNLVLFRLDNQPSTHPLCAVDYFSIGVDIPYDRVKSLISRLLMAKATKERINIGYDAVGDCSQNRIRVHRVG